MKFEKNVTGLKVGDRVALEPGIPCKACNFCRFGRYNLCPDMKFFATPPIDGSLQTYVYHPAEFCFLLPNNVSLEEGMMCEPLSVGVHACNRGEVKFGKSVLILGCGPIGLVTILVAKAYGAYPIIATDFNKERLKTALNCGATQVILLINDNEAKQMDMVLSEIKEVFRFNTGFDGPDVTIDCTGFENSIKTALEATKVGGKICIVGMGQSVINGISLVSASVKEIDIIGVFRYCNSYPTCLRLISSGGVNVKQLITHRFGFSSEEVLAGFEKAKSGEGIKIMFCLPCEAEK